MVAHDVVVLGLPAARPSPAAVLGVGAEVHVRRVEPHEERGVGRLGVPHEAQGLGEDLVVDGLHPLPGERAGVLDALAAVAVGPAVQHAAGTEPLAEVRELLLRRVVRQLRLLLGVEVVEVAEELVEAVHRRQELVAVAEVVLAELAGGVAEVLQGRGDRRVLGTQADVGAREAHLRQPGAVGVLAGDERRPSRRAGLLAVVVGEPDALVGDPVDVRGAVSHEAVGVAAEVADPDVVAPDDEDVRPVGHGASRDRNGRSDPSTLGVAGPRELTLRGWLRRFRRAGAPGGRRRRPGWSRRGRGRGSRAPTGRRRRRR